MRTVRGSPTDLLLRGGRKLQVYPVGREEPVRGRKRKGNNFRFDWELFLAENIEKTRADWQGNFIWGIEPLIRKEINQVGQVGKKSDKSRVTLLWLGDIEDDTAL